MFLILSSEFKHTKPFFVYLSVFPRRHLHVDLHHLPDELDVVPQALRGEAQVAPVLADRREHDLLVLLEARLRQGQGRPQLLHLPQVLVPYSVFSELLVYLILIVRTLIAARGRGGSTSKKPRQQSLKVARNPSAKRR